MKLLNLGLPLLLPLTLGGCSAKTLIRAETVLLSPPTALLANCPETPLSLEGSNGDLLEAARMLRLDLAECNQSKARLREWTEQANGGGE
jgi:hypothetical protein